jgi:Tfp pilus assembly protein PilX
MNTSHLPVRCATLGNSHQRGVVLFIALIVMVAMSLAAIALMRSVDTTSAVIGNLAFRQASILPANYAIEDAAAGLFNDAHPANIARIADVRVDTPAQNYYATHSQAAGWDDQYGIPQPLQTKAAATALTRKQADSATNTITYVIERMCNPNAPVIPADNSAAGTWCDMMPPKQSPGTTINDPMAAILSAQPFYRVTVRVDGPPGTNTVSFAQAMLR